MVRVVFDTNILIPAFPFSGKPEQLFELARSRSIHLLTSSNMLAEYANCLQPKFSWEDEDTDDAIRTVGYSAELVRPTAEIDILSNGADDRILECAIAGKADYIVSDDCHRIQLKKFTTEQIDFPVPLY